jgi:hypothetical protein
MRQGSSEEKIEDQSRVSVPLSQIFSLVCREGACGLWRILAQSKRPSARSLMKDHPPPTVIRAGPYSFACSPIQTSRNTMPSTSSLSLTIITQYRVLRKLPLNYNHNAVYGTEPSTSVASSR